MKINSVVLETFIKKVSINGVIETTIFKTNDEGMSTIITDPTNTTISKGVLYKKHFSEYSELTLPIVDNNRFLFLLGQYPKQEIELKVQQNNLVIVGRGTNKKVLISTMKLAEVDVIDNVLTEVPPSLNFDDAESVIIDTDVFTNAQKQITALKENNVHISVKDKMFEVTVGSSKFDSITQKQDLDYKDFYVKMGDVFLKVVEILPEKVHMKFKDNYPVYLLEKNDLFKHEIIVAPIVNEEPVTKVEEKVEEPKNDSNDSQ